MAILNNKVDIHSHILPGIDDGSKTLEESIETLRNLSEQGFTRVIATPHYMNETIYVSTYAKNVKAFSKLEKEMERAGVKIKIYLGNEIYIDEKILSLLKARKVTTLAQSKYLLIEVPLNEEFPNFEDYLMEFIENGYKVILAHPERYAIFQKDYDRLKELHETGVLLQSNYGSVYGKYGREAKKLVKKMIKDRLIFTFGSDMHHPSKEKKLELAEKKLSKYYSEEELKQLLVINPAKILVKRAA